MSDATPLVCLRANADEADAYAVSGANECMAVRMALAPTAHHFVTTCVKRL